MTSAPKEIRTYPPVQEAQGDETDLADLIGILIDSRWMIAVITATFFFLGLVHTVITTPIYRADALIQVEEKKSGFGDLDINSLFEGDTSVNAEIEILRSRLILGTVVDDLKLDISATPNFFPLFGAALDRRTPPGERQAISVDSLYLPDTLVGTQLKLVAGSSGAYELLDSEGERLLVGNVGEVAQGDYLGEPMSIFVSELRANKGDEFFVSRQFRLKSIEQLQATLVISEKGKGSGILSMALEGSNPGQVRQNLNHIADVYVRKNVERRSEEAERTLEFLDEQLPSVKQEMETAEVALNSYRLEKGSIDLPLETQAILETIVTVEGQLNEFQRERERVTQSFTPAHPIVIALDRQMESLNTEIAALNAQVRELPNTQQEVLRLVRDTQVNTELYTSLLNTAQELRVVKAGTVGNVRVVDYAAAPYKPVKPKKKLTLLISLLFGGMVGVVTAFVTKMMNSGVQDPRLVEKQLGIPVFATILHSKRQDRLRQKLETKEARRAILAVDSPDDVAIESLRNLRTALHFGMMQAKNNCIVISGPSPSVGKSFVSVNLAAVLTSNDKNVLLVDADMRRGHLHEFLGLKRENGLSNFVSGEISIGEAMHQTTVKGLTLIPTGDIPPNPAELLIHPRFANCLSVLAPKFDHIIIDSPPVLAATDATIIGQLAGATLMVLKAGEHPMREIEASLNYLRQANVNLPGLIFNDVRGVTSKRYGAGKYTYQYSYSK